LKIGDDSEFAVASLAANSNNTSKIIEIESEVKDIKTMGVNVDKKLGKLINFIKK